MLETTNPFAILGLDKSADKKQILKQVTLAMRARQYDAKTIANAQKQLFNPVMRGVEEFKHCIDMLSLLEPALMALNQDKTTHNTPTLALLTDFDEIKQ